jgi:hypothetical protein
MTGASKRIGGSGEDFVRKRTSDVCKTKLKNVARKLSWHPFPHSIDLVLGSTLPPQELTSTVSLLYRLI